jgi:hypothetical protein
MEDIFKTELDNILKDAFTKNGEKANKSPEQIDYDLAVAEFTTMALADAFVTGYKKNKPEIIAQGVMALVEYHKMRMAKFSFDAFMSLFPGNPKKLPFDGMSKPPVVKANWKFWVPGEKEEFINLEPFNGQQVVFIIHRGDFKFGKVAESTGLGYCVIWQNAQGNIQTFRSEEIKCICLQDEFTRANFSIMDYYGI